MSLNVNERVCVIIFTLRPISLNSMPNRFIALNLSVADYNNYTKLDCEFKMSKLYNQYSLTLSLKNNICLYTIIFPLGRSLRL